MDASHVPHRDGAPPDRQELLRRIRAAEAEIERLQNKVLSQENLADRLSAAMADKHRDNLVAQESDLRAKARAVVHRVRRRLNASRSPSDLGRIPVGYQSLDLESLRDQSDNRYAAWIELYDTVDSSVQRSLRDSLDGLHDPPLVSILMPVYNPPEDYLRQAIDSVRNQIYTKWELCISDDCSTQPYVTKVLDEYQALDVRIRVIRRESNGHISASSNSALSLASGQWICLMDHDDLLAEHALAVGVLALQDVPNAGLVYSDEDHVGVDGQREIPYFKPGFDPLLILGQNYFSHMSMMRADLVARVGGFRIGVEGSQDWDLALRIVEQLDPEQVLHVPHVLYHWRSHPDSTASNLAAKPYVVEASRRVVQDHLNRIGVRATAKTITGTSFNSIEWQLEDAPPKVSIIVLPRSGTRLSRCLDSIRIRSTYPNYEIVLLDDGAFRPPMRQYIRDNVNGLTVVPHVADISDSAQRNVAAASSSGDFLFFVHDDLEVLTKSWLEEMVGVLQYPGIGAVGAKLLYPDLDIQHAGIVVGIGGTVGNPHRLHFDSLSPGYFGRLMLAHCPSAVSWACMGVRRQAFDLIGGFNENHFTGMFGDVDFCLRLSQVGWRTGWTPNAELLHFENPDDTRGTDGENAIRFDRDIRLLNSTWANWANNDPAYNPNLSLAHESFSLAWPPRKPLPTIDSRGVCAPAKPKSLDTSETG